MNIANEYKRRFLYFMPEDKGFGNGLVPSGFVSFEVRNGRGKLTAFIENLSDTSQKYEYKLYLISCKEALTTPIYVANIKPVKNKSQINWVFDASDVGGSKLCLEDYDVVAVIAVHKERNSSIISPLVAYMGSKIEWKNKLRDALYIEKIEDNDKYSTTRQEHELASQTKQTGHIEHERQTKQTGKTAKIQQIVVAEQTGQQELAEQSAQIGQTLQADISEQAKQIERTEQTEQTEQTEHTEHTEQTVQTSEASAADETRAKTADSNFDSNSNSQQDTKFCKTCKDTECNKSSANKRNNDKFTSTFDKYLERCNPFNSDRKDYVWWRAGSTYYLNTILYWINLRTPIMLNPAVFNAACKYGHLLIGIYTNENNEKYLVFGIPGKHGTEIQPFGGLGRWAQADISKPEYDAFGYWLIYMDPNTARVIE